MTLSKRTTVQVKRALTGPQKAARGREQVALAPLCPELRRLPKVVLNVNRVLAVLREDEASASGTVPQQERHTEPRLLLPFHAIHKHGRKVRPRWVQ